MNQIKDLDAEVAQCLAQYKESSRYYRHLVQQQISRCQNLTNPSHHRRTIADVCSTKFRFNILSRWPTKMGNGIHNLNVGKDELVLSVYGVFNDSSDFRKGVFFVPSYCPFRFVFGQLLTCDEYMGSLEEELRAHRKDWKQQLFCGEYENFTREITELVDQSISVYKEQMRQNTNQDLP